MSDSINTTQAMDRSPYQPMTLENEKFRSVPSLGELKKPKSLKSLEPNSNHFDPKLSNMAKYQPSLNQKALKPLI